MIRNKAIFTKHVKPNNINLTGYRSLFFKNYEFKNVSDKQGFYEFGVFSGKSMIEMLDIFKTKEITLSEIYGFDSFQGIPKCEKEDLWNPVWGEGEFNSCDYLDVEDPSIAVKLIENEVREHLYSEEQNLTMYEGFFSDSLPKVSLEDLIPALFIDIDVDIYSSAKEALDFMAKNNLIKPGTIINYDDWGGSPGHEKYKTGESRAHKEICDEYNIECALVKQTSGQRCYEVKNIKGS